MMLIGSRAILSWSVLSVLVVIAGCSKAPQIQSTPPSPENGFAIAADAAFKGDLNSVKLAVESDARYAQAADDNGRTLLHYAAEGGQAEVVRYLLDNGARANVPDNDGVYPMEAAISGGASDEVKDLLREAVAREMGR